MSDIDYEAKPPMPPGLEAAEAERRRRQQAEAEAGEAKFYSTGSVAGLPPAQITVRPGAGLPTELRASNVPAKFEAGGSVGNPLLPTMPSQGGGVDAPKPPAESADYAPAPREKSAVELALEDRGLTPEQIAAMMASSARATQAAGYTPEQLKMSQDVQAARDLRLQGVQAERQAYEQFRKDIPTLEAEQVAASKKALAAEEGRAGRVEGMRAKQEELAEQGKRIADFKVQPERLFGQGQARAMSQFTLGIANALSNIGEAMQGKAGTNAILTIMRDRIAQDIELQEADYRRSLQGFNVQRNALMDAVKQIGDEREAAQAVAKAQGLAFADRLKQMARGVTDAQVARAFNDAEAKAREAFGVQETEVSKVNVAAANEAKARYASAVNTMRAEDARRVASTQSYIAGLEGVSDEQRKSISDIMKQANEKGLGRSAVVLQDLKKLLLMPGVADQIDSLRASFIDTVGRSQDEGSFNKWLASKAAQTFTPEQQQFMNMLTRFRALKSTSQGGKAITGIEDFLFNPFRNASPRTLGSTFDRLEGELEKDRDSLLRQGAFPRGSGASRALAELLYQEIPTAAKKTPDIPTTDSPGRSLP